MVDYEDHRVGSGTLRIKLKNSSEKDVLEDHKQVPEDHRDEDEGQIQKNNEDNSNGNDNRRRICHVCNKGFSSGKALGGHMRIHVQAAKKQLISGKKGKRLKPLVDRYYKKRILQQGDEEEEEEEQVDYNNQILPTCSICGKSFPSMKSLFGHMRCHPERAWRGIQPPYLKSIDKKMDSDTASGNLSKSVPRWSVTAKRGRKASSEATSSSGPKDEEQLHDAVHHLMLLANGDSIESGLTGGGAYNNKHDIPEEELEMTNSNSLTSKAETDELAYHVSESMIIGNRKRRKKMKLKFLDSVQDFTTPASVLHHEQHPAAAATPEKYKCNTCDKSFATHQALGGHMSSHNKFRVMIKNSINDPNSSAAGNDVIANVATSSVIGPVDASDKAVASTSKLFVDSNVHNNFTANRCQWGSPIDLHQTGPSSSQLTSPGEFSQTTTRHRTLNFDLNELPPDHEDAEYFPFLPI